MLQQYIFSALVGIHNIFGWMFYYNANSYFQIRAVNVIHSLSLFNSLESEYIKVIEWWKQWNLKTYNNTYLSFSLHYLSLHPAFWKFRKHAHESSCDVISKLIADKCLVIESHCQRTPISLSTQITDTRCHWRASVSRMETALVTVTPV